MIKKRFNKANIKGIGNICHFRIPLFLECNIIKSIFEKKKQQFICPFSTLNLLVYMQKIAQNCFLMIALTIFMDIKNKN